MSGFTTRRWVILLAALCTVALTARLGVWQLSRAAQKEALQALLDQRGHAPPLAAAELAETAAQAEAQHYRQLRIRGRWLDDRTVFLDNRQMNGRPGFFVLTPLQPESGGAAVLVQRGWAPRDQLDRTRLPLLPPASGPVELLALIAPPPSRLFQLGADAPGRIRQNLALDEFARETGLRLRPLSLLQLDAPVPVAGTPPPDGLLRQWPPPAIDVHKHYGYAFQWFALATLITVLYAWFQLIQPRRSARPVLPSRT